VIKNSDVTDEELITICAGVEGFLNSRPITYQSMNPSDDVPLTPNHFLHGQLGGEFAWTLTLVKDGVRYKQFCHEYGTAGRGGSRNFRTLVKFFPSCCHPGGGLLLSVCGGCSIISYSLFARQPTRLYCHDIVVSRDCLEFCFTHRHVLLINKFLTLLSTKRHII
jgi:hypothetical protein